MWWLLFSTVGPTFSLYLGDFQVQGGNIGRVYEVLADTIVRSSSIIRVLINSDEPDTISHLVLSRALCHHPAIQASDVTFCAEGHELWFARTPWWLRLMALDDMSLNLWPYILEKADTWRSSTSHSHLNVLYYLMREKNAVLLQNVRRRRIRKRKRFG